MRIIVLGAGHVGHTLVDALYQEHELTVLDVDTARLAMFADRYDVRTVQGDGTTRRIMQKAGASGPICCSPAARARTRTWSARCSSSGCRRPRRSCAPTAPSCSTRGGGARSTSTR